MGRIAGIFLLIGTCFANGVLRAAQLDSFGVLEPRAFGSASASSVASSSGVAPSSSGVPGFTQCQSVAPGPSICARACGPGYKECGTDVCYDPNKGQSCCSNGGICLNYERCVSGGRCEKVGGGGGGASGSSSVSKSPGSSVAPSNSVSKNPGSSAAPSSAAGGGGHSKAHFHSKHPNGSGGGGGGSTPSQSTSTSGATAAPRYAADGSAALLLAGLGAFLL